MEKNKLPIHFYPSGILAFFLSMAMVFLGYFLNYLGFRPFNFLHNLESHPKPSVNRIIDKKIRQSPKNSMILKDSPSFVQATDAQENVNVSSFIVINGKTGSIIESKNDNTPLSIASLTKIMSAVVTLDLVNPNTYFTVTNTASQEPPTKIGVIAGQEMSVSELLHAALMTSANDAVEVLREGVDKIYSKGAFILAMNEKAKILGLSNTSFNNPQGFDSTQNYSTAHDLAILSAYALSNYPLISEIAKEDYIFLPQDKNYKQFDLYNWNGLLDVYPGVKGLKIGNTGNAGYTTIVSSERDGQEIIAVVLGEPDITQRDITAAGLLDAGFESVGIPPANISVPDLLAKYATWKYFN